MADQTPPADKAPKFVPLEHQTYSLYFALSGFFLVIVSLWAIWDETYTRRPWKGYQQEFPKVAKPVYQKALREAEEKVAKKSKDLDYYQAWSRWREGFPSGDPEFTKVVARIKEQFPDLKDAKDPAELLKEVRKARGKLDAKIADERKNLNLVRGRFAAAVWQVEVEPTNSRAEGVIKGSEPEVKKLQDKVNELEKARRQLLDAEADLTKPQQEAEAKLAEFHKERDAAARALTALDNEGVTLRQTYNPDLGPLGTVDRCESCHMGADRPGLEGLPQPFATHSGDWLKTHPKEKFACTSCHDGDGVGTTSVAEAHGEDPFWLKPMLPGKMMQAACYKCHETQVALKGADTLMAGKRLFREVGCIGCHKIRGIGDDDAELSDLRLAMAGLRKDIEALKAKAAESKEPVADDQTRLRQLEGELSTKLGREAELVREVKQVGPDLTGLKGKVAPGWIEAWLIDPKAFRPTTRMPRFWPAPHTGNEEKDKAARAEQMEEVRAIAAYLWENSTDVTGGAAAPAPAPEAAGRGKQIVDTFGCKGCHNIDAADARLMGDRRFGPELSRVGEKARPEWIARWVKNPKAVMPHAKMPNLRLDDAQAADVAAYLATLKSKEPVAGAMPEYLKDDAQRQKLAARGKELIKHYGCFGCHTIKGMEGQGKIGVELTVEGSKMVEEFDYGLLEHSMKAPLGGVVWQDWLKARFTGTALAELTSGKHHVDAHHNPREWAGLVKKSIDKVTYDLVSQLFKPYRGTNDVPLTRQGYIATKLMNPRIFDTGKRKAWADRLKMPDFGLSIEEIYALTTFVIANNADVDAMRSPWKDRPTGRREAIIEGQKVIEKNNCNGCHRFERNMPANIKALAHEMFAGYAPDKAVKDQTPRWAQELDTAVVHNRLTFMQPDIKRTLVTDKQEPDEAKRKQKQALEDAKFWRVLERAIMEADLYPNYRRVQEERNKALPPPKNADDEDAPEPEALATADELMGLNPPPLFYQGERAKPDWLFGFLKNPEILRSWLPIKMPTFDLSDGDTRRLVRYFAAHDDVDFPFATPKIPRIDANSHKTAGEILQVSCLPCHKPLPPNFTAAQAAASAPDLKLAHRRLRPDWVARWALDPEGYLPGTRMPVSFPHPQYPQFAGGKAEDQARAMAAYLSTYGAGEAPALAPAGDAGPAPAPTGEAPAPAATPAPGASPAPAGETPAPAPGASPAAAAPGAANPADAPAEQKPSDADKGTLKGVVKFDGAPPKAKKIAMSTEAVCKAHHESTGQPARDETVVVNADGTLKNVIVYVKSGLTGKFDVPAEPVVLDQKGCQYVPHVWGMMAGQTLRILNSDSGVLHNIHTFSDKGNSFNKGQPGTPGAQMDERFASPELPVKVKCDVHGWMTSYAGVFEHPFHSTTRGNGVFYIRNLPPGEYEIEAWHEKYPAQTQKISVKAGETKELTFTFKGE